MRVNADLILDTLSFHPEICLVAIEPVSDFG
jgi:hypothetical protein